MFELYAALTRIRADLERLARFEADRIAILNDTQLPLAMKDERERDAKLDIDKQRGRIIDVLHDLIAFPPHHARHAQKLNDFHQAAGFERSVFIMTKYPDPQNPTALDPQLSTVIKAVRDAVTNCGYTPRLASDDEFHSLLWDNVELYLLGCKRGIAIVEDRYRPELNPNVAMEWGWMRGMGRDVLYLVEDGFTKDRADWSGLIEKRFDWADPAQGVRSAVAEWLK